MLRQAPKVCLDLSFMEVQQTQNTAIEKTEETAETKEPLLWYAMRVTYRRELSVKEKLEAEGMECFCPMRYEVQTVGKRKVRSHVPAVHNLLFVRAGEERLKQFKSRVPYLQYMTRPLDGKNRIITIPDRQMAQFMAVASGENDKLIYLKPEEINLAKGTKVRIIGGAFNNVEGIFVKVKDVRSRRVVLLVEGITAVALAEVHPDLLEVLE